MLELADVDLPDEGGNVLVVLVARLGLRHADLAQLGRIELDHGKPRQIAVEGVEALGRPRRADAGQAPRRNAVSAFERLAHRLGAEQAEGRFEHRADLVACGQHIDRLGLHQGLEAFGQRRLAAANRAEQVEDLLALLETLSCMLEITHHPLDRVFHPEEPGHRRIDLDGAVEEDAAEAGILGRVDDNRVADRGDHPLGRARRHSRVVPATFEIIGQAHRLAPLTRIGR